MTEQNEASSFRVIDIRETNWIFVLFPKINFKMYYHIPNLDDGVRPGLLRFGKRDSEIPGKEECRL